MFLAIFCRSSRQKRSLRLYVGQSKGYVSCPNKMTAKYPQRRTENSSSTDRSQKEKQELFAKKATENDQMQQKHLPFKMKSSYGKTMYQANKLQSQYLSTPIFINQFKQSWIPKMTDIKKEHQTLIILLQYGR